MTSDIAATDRRHAFVAVPFTRLLGVDDGIASCRARVVDDTGLLVAHGQGSFRYLPHR